MVRLNLRPQAVKVGTFSFARVTGPGETYAVRTAVDSLIEFANFSSNIFSDSRVYSNWEPQHIIGKFDAFERQSYPIVGR